MEQNFISEFIIGKFGEKIFQKSQNFPNNKINIIFSRNKPIKINAIILDNDREFHLVINEKKNEIFHDCPRFLIHSEKEKNQGHMRKLKNRRNKNKKIKGQRSTQKDQDWVFEERFDTIKDESERIHEVFFLVFPEIIISL